LILLLLLIQAGELERILKEWGLPTAMLIVVVLGLRAAAKWVSPLIVNYFTTSQELLKSQLDLSNTRQANQETKFLEALNRQRDENIAAIMGQAEITAAAVERQSKALTEVLQKQTEAIESIGKLIREQAKKE
jgi:hypothetical protein